MEGGNIAGSLNFQGGALQGSGTINGAVTVTSGGSVQIGRNSGRITISALTINSNGSLDITNNELIVDYGNGTDPKTQILQYLASGYNAGGWNGTGIDSSAALSHGAYGVGFADGADGVVSGLISGQIEIKYTLNGDADLDGSVTGSDFTILASNLGKSVVGWDKGDFDYDGTVSGSDFTALVRNLGKTANTAAVVLPSVTLLATSATTPPASSTLKTASGSTASNSASNGAKNQGKVLAISKKVKIGHGHKV